MFKAISILVAFVAATLLYGGTGTLSSISGGRVQTSHVNQYYSALNQDFVPRNSSGAPTNRGGSLGSSVYKWLKLWVESGSWAAGDIKLHHSYNGTVKCGQGWMIADGDIINETNYDADTAAGHAAGDWDTYVVTSPLDGKYAPNFVDKYPNGVAATTQTGVSAITSIGGNTINIAHTHTVDSHTHTIPAHKHKWYTPASGGTSATSYDNAGSSSSFGAGISSGSGFGIVTGTATTANGLSLAGMGQSFWTEPWSDTSGGTGPGTDSQLSSSQGIRPESIEVQYCIRVID